MKVKIDKKEYDIEVCDGFFSQFRGLMFRDIKDKGLLFSFKKPRKLSLHTFFVFYPIDIYFLDENKKIIDSKLNVRPFRLFVRGVKCSYILEVKSIC